MLRTSHVYRIFDVQPKMPNEAQCLAMLKIIPYLNETICWASTNFSLLYQIKLNCPLLETRYV